MKTPQIFAQKKTIIIEVVILVLFVLGGYYLYGMLSQDDTSTTEVTTNTQLLGTNVVSFLKAQNQDKLSFRDVSFMESTLVKGLRDFTETISPTVSRGRVDPFIPYASSRSIR